MRSILLSLLLATAANAAPVDVARLDGSTVSGELVEWTRNSVTIKGESGAKRIPAAGLLGITWKSKAAPDDSATFLELIDGSRVRITSFSTINHRATIATPYIDKSTLIPTEQIHSVELTPRTEAAAVVWQELESNDLSGDVLIVSKREGQSFDYLAGVAGDVTPEQASFEWEGERMKVKRSKIAAILYYHKQAVQFPDSVCELTTADGSRIPVRELNLREGVLQGITPAGVSVHVDLDDIVHADFSAGKLAYLSDLKPIEVKWTPRIAAPAGADVVAAFGLPRYDESFTGSELSLLWKDDAQIARRLVRSYDKGLAIRSRTELTWRLPAGMQRFTAIAGIDPQSAGQGRVDLQIRADGKMLWEGPVSGLTPPVPLDLDLRGARRLQITVDYGENLDYGDRLHLVEARVTK